MVIGALQFVANHLAPTKIGPKMTAVRAHYLNNAIGTAEDHNPPIEKVEAFYLTRSDVVCQAHWIPVDVKATFALPGHTLPACLGSCFSRGLCCNLLHLTHPVI
jgi:hypothetical protein